jgi:hypothetical protein
MIAALNCTFLKDALVDHVTAQIGVDQLRDLCVITLPIRTLDGRLVDVFVEQRVGGYLLVHDGGKAANELILRGMDITPGINQFCLAIASRMGVTWADEMFQHGCKVEQVSMVCMAIGGCSAMTMSQLVGYAAQEEPEPIREQVKRALKKWGKKTVRIEDNVKVAGGIKQHKFDFVAYPKGDPIAVSILTPSVSAISAADRFALKSIDLKGSAYGKWKPLAIRTHAEMWSEEASGIVEACSSGVVDVRSGETIDNAEVAEVLARLAA